MIYALRYELGVQEGELFVAISTCLDLRLGCVFIYGEQKVGRCIYQCPAFIFKFPAQRWDLVQVRSICPIGLGKVSFKNRPTQIITQFT